MISNFKNSSLSSHNEIIYINKTENNEIMRTIVLKSNRYYEIINSNRYKYFNTQMLLTKRKYSTSKIATKSNIGIGNISLIKNPICATYYKNVVSQDLCLKQNYKNIMELASFQQIACNTSSKNYTIDREAILPAIAALEIITGQKPKSTCAKKSISSFKLRQFQILGCKTSLRGRKMYEFLEKFISIQPAITSNSISSIEFKRKSGDYVILNCNVFPELQQHDELFQNVSGIQISFSMKSTKKSSFQGYSSRSDGLKKYRYKQTNSLILLTSAFQLL